MFLIFKDYLKILPLYILGVLASGYLGEITGWNPAMAYPGWALSALAPVWPLYRFQLRLDHSFPLFVLLYLTVFLIAAGISPFLYMFFRVYWTAFVLQQPV